MKAFATAALIAAAAPLAAAADGFAVGWTIAGDKCDVVPGTSVKLGEFTKSANCKTGECAVLTEGGITGFSTLNACVDDFVTGAESVLKGDDPYVIVGVYNETAKCDGDFNVAIAVKADGSCIPGTNGKASYNVTWTFETGVTWLQYTNGKCSGEPVKVDFKPEETLGKTCTLNTLRAWAFPPKDFVAPTTAPTSEPESNSSTPENAAAGGYAVGWTISGTKCDVVPGESVKLGEFTKTTTCKVGECAELTEGGITDFSTLNACVDDFVTGAESVLKGTDPYVIVGVYNETAKCEGDFNVAIAVKADGTCIPGTNGKASYNVTWAFETGVTWLQYTNGKCSGEPVKVDFKPEETLGTTCTLNTLRAWAFPPKDFVAPTSTPAPVPAPTSSAIKTVGAAAVTVFAIIATTLA